MAFVQWRRFVFFGKEAVKDPNASALGAAGSAPEGTLSALQSLNITACTSGGGQVVFGDGSGYIHLADRSFTLSSFQAYAVSVTHLHQMKQRNILISVGDDEEGINPVLKVWNLDKSDKNKNPLCTRVLKIVTEGKLVPVSVIAVIENLSQLAVGLANGVVILYRGDLSRDRFAKPKILHKGTHPITGLGFREQGKNTYLFVATSDYVECYLTNVGSTVRDTKERLDEEGCAQGCELACCCISEPEQDFVLARPEAFFFYGPDGRGPAIAFDGEKKLVSWFRGYLVVAGRDAKAFNSSVAKGNNRVNSLTIYDIKNKLIAYSGTFNDITHIVSEWGSVFVITGDKQIFQLEEKDTATKLDMLFKKHLYPMAITLAYSANYDMASIIEIFRKYGDHLYSKGDYDQAIAQYQKTIGRLEPSYVIRKFLDAQRIKNLTSYLQALHEQGIANADHTTLLLNCYTKAKDNDRLDAFIKTDKELNFDVETAIKVCRQAQYHRHALYLAKKFEQHEWYLKIQLEDVNDYEDALDYISRLDFFEAERNLKLYGKVLVNYLPEQTTALLMKLCTDFNPVTSAPPAPTPAPAPVVQSSSPASTVTAASLNAEPIAPPEPKPQKAKVKSSPEGFIHIYVNQNKWLTRFLEFMVKQQPNSSSIVYNTLLELYLKEDAISGKLSSRDKAMELLRNPDANFDLDQALVLAKMHDFKPGLLYLYEKSKLFQEIVQYYMDNNEYTNVINSCKKYGGKDPNLWVQVLSYFASKQEDCRKEIVEVLASIDKLNLLPPLQVIQILSQNSNVTLSVVKDYVTSRMQTEDQQIREDQRMVRQYQDDTEKMRQEIEELRTSAKLFQLMKCSACSNPLDLPAVHFLCMHSFHQRCLGDNEKECPICAPSNRTILEIKRSQEQNAHRHDQFSKQLETSEDGFGVVADYFGRNVFNKIVLMDATPQPLPPRPTRQ